MVAPNGIVHTRQLYQGMRAFYEELLLSGDGDASVRALNDAGAEDDSDLQYHWRSAEGVFRDVYRETIARTLKGKQGKAFLDEQLTKHMSKPHGRQAGLSRTRKALKAATLEALRPAFNKARDRYLMLDEFPEQRERFTLTYEDCLSNQSRK